MSGHLRPPSHATPMIRTLDYMQQRGRHPGRLIATMAVATLASTLSPATAPPPATAHAPADTSVDSSPSLTTPALPSPALTLPVDPDSAIQAIPHRYAGYESTFDVFVGPVDRSRPVGAMFYFDGDKADEALLSYNKPLFVAAMTQTAAAHNLVFIPVHTPLTYDLEGPEYLWWDIRDKGDFARDVAQQAVRMLHLDPRHLWFTAFSGGAEMVMSELLSHDRDWIKGGGAVVMGGGVAEYGVEPAGAATPDLRLLWVAGDMDGELEPLGDEWSAQLAARAGFQSYSDAGFRHLSFLTLPGQDHGYDIAGVVDMGMARVDPMPPHLSESTRNLAQTP